MPETEPILSVSALSFAFPDSKVLFADASFAIAPGEKVGLFAENGSGKTTFLRIVTGLERRLHSGTIRLAGATVASEADFAALRRRVGYVLQSADDQLFFPQVLEDAMFGPLNLGCTPEQARARALEALELLGIAHLAECDSFHLSGGQKHLAAIACILAMKPDVLLLDEPTTGLDVAAQQNLLAALTELPCAMVTVSHHPDFLQALSGRLVTIRAQHFEDLKDIPPSQLQAHHHHHG